MDYTEITRGVKLSRRQEIELLQIEASCRWGDIPPQYALARFLNNMPAKYWMTVHPTLSDYEAFQVAQVFIAKVMAELKRKEALKEKGME